MKDSVSFIVIIFIALVVGFLAFNLTMDSCGENIKSMPETKSVLEK